MSDKLMMTTANAFRNTLMAIFLLPALIYQALMGMFRKIISYSDEFFWVFKLSVQTGLFLFTVDRYLQGNMITALIFGALFVLTTRRDEGY